MKSCFLLSKANNTFFPGKQLKQTDTGGRWCNVTNVSCTKYTSTNFFIDMFGRGVWKYLDITLFTRRFRLLQNFMKNAKIASPRAVFSLKFHRIWNPTQFAKFIPLPLNFQLSDRVSRQACSLNVHVHVFRSMPSCTMATPLETRKKVRLFSSSSHFMS